jgi:hypothetical protein
MIGWPGLRAEAEDWPRAAASSERDLCRLPRFFPEFFWTQPAAFDTIPPIAW